MSHIVRLNQKYTTDLALAIAIAKKKADAASNGNYIVVRWAKKGPGVYKVLWSTASEVNDLVVFIARTSSSPGPAQFKSSREYMADAGQHLAFE